MWISATFGLINCKKKTVYFLGLELPIFDWENLWNLQIYLWDVDSNLWTGNEYIKLPFCYQTFLIDIKGIYSCSFSNFKDSN